VRVVILEDERPALAQLVAALEAFDPTARVVATHDSVEEAVRWFRAEPEPDVVLADIRLTDGPSVEVFEAVELGCPVLFVTAYDQYTQRALAAGGIDYVLKPVSAERLGQGLDKVLRLRRHFLSVDRAGREATPGGRQRVLVRRGHELRAVAVADITWFTTEHRLVLAVTRDGRRHVVDSTLAELEAQLDPGRFFRVGRGDIVAVDAVRTVRPHGRGRLRVEVEPDGEATVSAEHAAAFRAWWDR